VPHTRSMSDMLTLLNVIQVNDPIAAGDFWREQKAVKLPPVESIRPKDMLSLAKTGALKGKRIGVPTMYINKDDSGARAIKTRASVMALWEKAAADLRALGAEVVEVDFIVMHNFEGDRQSAQTPVTRGLIPEGWLQTAAAPASTSAAAPPTRPPANLEFAQLNPYFMEEFVRLTGDPNLPSWTKVKDLAMVYPTEPGGPDEKARGLARDYTVAVKTIAAGQKHPSELPGFAEAMRGLETVRKVDFEDWMKTNKLDLVVFPAAADVGKADTNTVEASYQDGALRNGVYFSNMNSVLRYLGIPSVSVPMGLMSDIGMPMNLTFIGAAYTDPQLLQYAYDYEQKTRHRVPPKRTPALADEVITYDAAKVVAPSKRAEKTPPALELNIASRFDKTQLAISGKATDQTGVADVRVYVNGQKVPTTGTGAWTANYEAKANIADRNLTVTVLAKDTLGNANAAVRYFSVAPDGTLTAMPSAALPPCDICRGKPL
jgi:amidase